MRICDLRAWQKCSAIWDGRPAEGEHDTDAEQDPGPHLRAPPFPRVLRGRLERVDLLLEPAKGQHHRREI